MAAHADARELRVTKQEEEAYYRSARAWDDDRVANAMKSRRAAWWVAGLACGLSALLAFAVAALTPLRRVEPYLVRVDSATGIVDNVVRVADTQLGKDEVMNRYFLRRYVTLRESYRRQELQGNYEQLFLLSAPKVRAELKQEWQLGAPTSPYTIYGDNGTATVKVTSVTFLRDDIAQVRSYVVEKKNGAESERHLIATIEFRFLAAPAGEEARSVNPLGFQCTSWRVDEEAVVSDGEKPR
jgi:type IV secretion system protein VirB8